MSIYTVEAYTPTGQALMGVADQSLVFSYPSQSFVPVTGSDFVTQEVPVQVRGLVGGVAATWNNYLNGEISLQPATPQQSGNDVLSVPTPIFSTFCDCAGTELQFVTVTPDP